ncbi:hypothetical protein TK45_03260 [Bowmanella sp. JS7-9]|nr:hypothetical protein TK45_03260 [Bowmanella sp. JS7-9]
MNLGIIILDGSLAVCTNETVNSLLAERKQDLKIKLVQSVNTGTITSQYFHKNKNTSEVQYDL